MLVRNSYDLPTRDATIAMLMSRDERPAARKTYLMTRSRINRRRLPLRSTGGGCAVLTPAIGDSPDLDRDKGETLAGRPTRVGLTARALPRPDVLVDLRVRHRHVAGLGDHLGEVLGRHVVVDERLHGLVVGRLGVVRVDEQRARDRVGAPPDRLPRRPHALAGLGVEHLDRLQVL